MRLDHPIPPLTLSEEEGKGDVGTVGSPPEDGPSVGGASPNRSEVRRRHDEHRCSTAASS